MGTGHCWAALASGAAVLLSACAGPEPATPGASAEPPAQSAPVNSAPANSAPANSAPAKADPHTPAKPPAPVAVSPGSPPAGAPLAPESLPNKPQTIPEQVAPAR